MLERERERATQPVQRLAVRRQARRHVGGRVGGRGRVRGRGGAAVARPRRLLVCAEQPRHQRRQCCHGVGRRDWATAAKLKQHLLRLAALAARHERQRLADLTARVAARPQPLQRRPPLRQLGAAKLRARERGNCGRHLLGKQLVGRSPHLLLYRHLGRRNRAARRLRLLCKGQVQRARELRRHAL